MSNKRILICGDRNWTDKESIKNRLLEEIKRDGCAGITIINGGCKGADKLSTEAAKELGLIVEIYPAQWELYGIAAGPIRNQTMLDNGKPDEVWAFHPDIRESKGTKDMVNRAFKYMKEKRCLKIDAANNAICFAFLRIFTK